MTALLRGCTFAAIAVVLAVTPLHAQDSGANAPPIEPATHTQILDAVAQNGAQITVLNFWATWCAPCVEEFPHFVRFGREFADRGVQVTFVSVDFAEDRSAAQAFLAEQGVTERTFLKEGKSTPFVNGFSEDWSGAVPATFVYGPDGTLLDFWEEKTDYETLKRRVTRHLKDT